ncbi:type VII secretion target [Streptomyces natalensis]|uniref:type VII secretion target n=1 Tax=Streptomyces natalensis TaxID=68242 RepID=UPI000B008DFF|nr:type VII secretion target [Streptomyces natalensis]
MIERNKGAPVGDIRVDTAKVRSTGDDMQALSSDTQRRLSHVLDSSWEVYYDALLWKSGNAVTSCRTAWEDHMVELAKKMGELGQKLQDSADGYDAADQEAVSRLRAGMQDLGRH